MSTTQGEFDFTASADARDDGIARVSEHNERWMDYAVALVQTLPATWEGLIEGIRQWFLENQWRMPEHENAWGALANVLVKKGIIARTGEYRASRAVKSHARQQPVWRLLTEKVEKA